MAESGVAGSEVSSEFVYDEESKTLTVRHVHKIHVGNVDTGHVGDIHHHHHVSESVQDQEKECDESSYEEMEVDANIEPINKAGAFEADPRILQRLQKVLSDYQNPGKWRNNRELCFELVSLFQDQGNAVLTKVWFDSVHFFVSVKLGPDHDAFLRACTDGTLSRGLTKLLVTPELEEAAGVKLRVRLDVKATPTTIKDSAPAEQQASHAPPVSTVQGASSQSSHGEEGHDEVEPDGEGFYMQKMKQAKPSEQQLDLEKNYKMDALTKGHVFILNMSKDREGSDVDVCNIKHVFEEIGYKITIYTDLTAKILTDTLEKFAKSSRHEGMGSAVFFFMGHGTKTGIKCTNKEVTYDVISNKVSETKYMNGKPKIIFFLSSGGVQHEERVETDQADTMTEIPAKSDVVMVYATTAENYGYRNTVYGSWFVQMLCEEFLENAHVSDLSTMLEHITQKIGKMVFKKRDSGDKKYGQSPVVVKQGISKKIYFLPKYCSKE